MSWKDYPGRRLDRAVRVFQGRFVQATHLDQLVYLLARWLA